MNRKPELHEEEQRQRAEAMRHAGRVSGKVVGTFPDRGFFWIMGDDGVKYFAHQTKVKGGFSVLEMWEGQTCTFTPGPGDGRGPQAGEIEMEEI